MHKKPFKYIFMPFLAYNTDQTLIETQQQATNALGKAFQKIASRDAINI